MINVIWAINDSFWDMALPKYILKRAYHCQHFHGLQWAKDLVGTKVGVIVIPGQHCTERYDELNAAAENFHKIIFIIVGDEEAKFEVAKLKHTSKIVWWFAPPFNPKQNVHRVGPFGWPSDTLEMINTAHCEIGKVEREYVFNFCGQVTHQRRQDCFKAAMLTCGKSIIYPTQGFAQGMPRMDYYENLIRSQFVLCPSGPCMPDSFRFAEALEAGCVPIVDGFAPNPDYPEGYWEYLFGRDLPFPVVKDWFTLSDLIPSLVPKFDEMQRRCSSWWYTQKDLMVARMQGDLIHV